MMLFQKDDHRAGFTVRREGGGHVLRLETASGADGAIELARTVLGHYAGDIYLRTQWRDGEYVFEWSMEEDGAYRELAQLPGDTLVSKGYTGAYLGLYATANGGRQDDHADFDWVRYQPR